MAFQETAEALPTATSVPTTVATPTEIPTFMTTATFVPTPTVAPTPKNVPSATPIPTSPAASTITPTPTVPPSPTLIDLTPTPTPTVAMLLAELISDSLIDKQILPVNYDLNRYSEDVQFTFTFQNISTKEIRAFTGAAKFSDIFDRPIKSIEITYDEPLKAGKQVIWQGLWDPNQFIDEDQKLVNTALKNLIFSFKTEAVIFMDGSRLGTNGATTTTIPGSALPTPTPTPVPTPTPGPTPTPTNFLDLQPDSGPPGTLVTVVGVGFNMGNGPLSELNIGDVDVLPVPVPRTTSGGAFTVEIIVPNLPPGAYIVQATVGKMTTEMAFTVAAMPTPTPKPIPQGASKSNIRIAISQKQVYVADGRSIQVRVYSLGGTLLQEWSAERLRTEDISGIAVQDNRIYLTDMFNHQVMSFTTNGSFLSQWGTEGTAERQFRGPGGIAVDGVEVYVVDTGNNRVQRLGLGGGFITTWGSPEDGEGQFQHIDVYRDRAFVVDTGNNRVQFFSLACSILGEWGSEGSGKGQFRTPTDIDVHGTTVYVSDEGNNRMQMFTLGGGFLGSWSIHR